MRKKENVFDSFNSFDSLGKLIQAPAEHHQPEVKRKKHHVNPTKRYFCDHMTKARRKMAKESRRKNRRK